MSGLAERYPYVMHQSLIWRDMDAFQHVNNAVYFRYFEDVRMRWFEEAGLIRLMKRTGVGPILASTRCDFRAPLTFPDRIQVGAVVADIKAKRFTMEYGVYSEGLDALVAEGEGLLVYYDYGASRSCEIPAEALAKIATLAAA